MSDRFMTQAEEALRAVAEAAYWQLSWTWQSHLYDAPKHVFDMTIFAPEARDMMNNVDQKLFDTLKAYAGLR